MQTTGLLSHADSTGVPTRVACPEATGEPHRASDSADWASAAMIRTDEPGVALYAGSVIGVTLRDLKAWSAWKFTAESLNCEHQLHHRPPILRAAGNRQQVRQDLRLAGAVRVATVNFGRVDDVLWLKRRNLGTLPAKTAQYHKASVYRSLKYCSDCVDSRKNAMGGGG